MVDDTISPGGKEERGFREKLVGFRAMLSDVELCCY